MIHSKCEVFCLRLRLDETGSVYETWVVMADARKQADQSPNVEEPEHEPLAQCSGNSLDELDEHALAALYEEFADEDRALANQGLVEYAAALSALDQES
jgi:hypothetical protein